MNPSWIPIEVIGNVREGRWDRSVNWGMLVSVVMAAQGEVW